MLAAFRTTTTRAVTFNAPRPFRAGIRRPCFAVAARTFYHATAEFTKLGSGGTLVTEEVSIRVGDPEEAYICVPTEVGYALQASGPLTNSSSALSKRLDRFALTYFHDTRHFALDLSPGCPRLVIPQQLPRQSTANTSPATLYLYGLMHQIALDGTPDAEFAEIASTILPDLGVVLDRLKDM
ncbi:hypothetical protein K505DRAFT_314615 [Melanomma pulvis-pyrius CBS 109.77]|uniref:Uncharacterized protein n=1 Tax=Melanomma pulvis-pyrius CBS 109.77 TaxID=1314802 RepID=A0A6A6WXI0_9PLEO|nr:hypothetical protein K505DRAFT_314615 [Melanomma pulvis-pyrius CBS 109.77]